MSDIWMFRGCLIPIGAIVAISALAWYESGSRQSTPAWGNVAECYREHVRAAHGNYPVAGDDSSALGEFCRRAVSETFSCGFDCEMTSVGWEFAVTAPRGQRDARVRAYFRRQR